LFAVEAVKAMQTMMDIALNRFYQILHRVPHYDVQISFILGTLAKIYYAVDHGQLLRVLRLRETRSLWQLLIIGRYWTAVVIILFR
jgi:hypothetical protein